LAREDGIPVLAFLAWPFAQEDLDAAAQRGLTAMESTCDGLIVLDNEAAFTLTGIQTRRDAAQMVNAMIGQVLLDLHDRVHEAFPFSVREELADFIGDLPEGNMDLPLRAAQWDGLQRDNDPLPMDPRGIVELR
jgi:cell division GTPase FtsZ